VLNAANGHPHKQMPPASVRAGVARRAGLPEEPQAFAVASPLRRWDKNITRLTGFTEGAYRRRSGRDPADALAVELRQEICVPLGGTFLWKLSLAYIYDSTSPLPYALELYRSGVDNMYNLPYKGGALNDIA
jgi:hypothetical protein